MILTIKWKKHYSIACFLIVWRSFSLAFAFYYEALLVIYNLLSNISLQIFSDNCLMRITMYTTFVQNVAYSISKICMNNLLDFVGMLFCYSHGSGEDP